MANDTQQNIEDSIQQTGSADQVAADNAAKEKAQPKQIYKLDPKTKIPVSRFEGPLWQGRKKSGTKQIAGLLDAWHEAEAYYGNSQMEHRRITEGQWKGNDVVSKNRNRKFSSTENMVYATVNAVIPSTYAKNPSVEVTMTDQSLEEQGTALKHFMNNLAHREDAPGINLKPKVRKSIMRCEITNEAWIMVGYTMKEASADQAMADINRIGLKLQNATDSKEIEKLEGELLALEESCDLLDPAGPFVKSVRGDQIIIDPMSVEDDHSDANWMMVRMMLPTNYLNARFYQENADGTAVSAYKASHVVDASNANEAGGTTAEQKEIDAFHIFDAGKDNPADYGYDDKRTYDRAKRTLVWYCFDKVKRRFYLYADTDWTWPIWVYNDPYHLPRFYPLRKLQYHTDPRTNRTKGEVSHYLDQQDDLNTIADELNRARTALRDKVIFDATVMDQATVESIMLDPNRKFVGVKPQEGKSLKDSIMGQPLPALEMKQLWDRGPAMQAINQISGIGDAMRGEQFKTNTTNEAIDKYSSISDTRLDEKRDAIEDFVGGIMNDVLFLCLQFMPVDQFISITGSQYAKAYDGFQNMQPKDIRDKVQMRIEGGSTQKPTSAAKKAEALQVSQILGQFARAVPYAGVVALEVLEHAFDSISIEAANWEKIEQMMVMSLQQAGAGPGGAQQQQQGQEQPPNEDAIVQQVIQAAKARGKVVTPEQARAAVQQRLNGGQAQPQVTH